MSWLQRSALAVGLGLAGLVIVGRVREASGSGGGRGPADSPMKGAQYAVAIPVYPGARLTDILGGNYYAELGGEVTFSSQSWFFEVADPVREIVAFYRERMPAGYRPEEAEAGSVAFQWTPPGAAEGESVTVIVRAGQLQIGETVRRAVRKAGSAS
jgi:hypothetical protein